MATKTKTLVDPSGQLTFLNVPNSFDRGGWRLYGKYIGAHGSDLAKKEAALAEECGWLMWDIGDWLLEGEEGGLNRKTLRREAEQIIINRKWQTLKNWKVTSRAIESSRRRDGREGRPSLPYSVHKEVEKFDADYQDSMLAEAVEQDARTVTAFRALVQERQKSGAEKAKPLPVKLKYANIKVRLSNYHYHFLKAIDPHSWPGGTASHIVCEYIKQNLDALVALAIEYEPRWSTVPRQFLATGGLAERLPRIKPDKPD